jgi:hypothetical protein
MEEMMNGWMEEMMNGWAEEKNDRKIGNGWLKIGFDTDLLQNHPNLTKEPKIEKIKRF